MRIDLFSFYVLFSQCRPCDSTLENRFFQISSYSRAHVRKKKMKIQRAKETVIGKTTHILNSNHNEKSAWSAAWCDLKRCFLPNAVKTSFKASNSSIYNKSEGSTRMNHNKPRDLNEACSAWIHLFL